MPTLRSFLHTIMETLREIFDENAYARFLARQGTVASRESYAAFLKDIECTRAKRPRCC